MAKSRKTDNPGDGTDLPSDGTDLATDFFMALLLAAKRRKYPYMALGDQRIMKPQVLKDARNLIRKTCAGLPERLFLGNETEHLDDYCYHRELASKDPKSAIEWLLEPSSHQYNRSKDRLYYLEQGHSNCNVSDDGKCLVEFIKNTNNIYKSGGIRYIPVKEFACALAYLIESFYRIHEIEYQPRPRHLISPDHLVYIELLEQEAKLSYQKADEQGNNADAQDLKKVFKKIKETRLYTLDWLRLAWGDYRLSPRKINKKLLGKPYPRRYVPLEYPKIPGSHRKDIGQEVSRYAKERRLWLSEEEVIEINKRLQTK